MAAKKITIPLAGGGRVSGLLDAPAKPLALYVLAHGAGAGMAHPFMAAVAAELVPRRIATLRYQFPYMEAGSKRPDPPARAHSAVRAAVDEAALLLQGTRDALADLTQLEPLVKTLGKRAALKLFKDADHSFHVPAKSGRKDAEVRAEMLDALA